MMHDDKISLTLLILKFLETDVTEDIKYCFSILWKG